MKAPGVVLVALAVLAGCSSSGGTGSVTHSPGAPTPTPGASASPSPTPMPSGGTVACTTPGVMQSIGPSGGTISTAGPTGTFAETFPAGAFATSTTVTLCYVAQPNLTAPLSRVRHVAAAGKREPQFTAGSGNTYIVAFTTTFGGATPAIAPSLTGTAIVPNSIAANTQLNIAINANSTYSDVGTAQVGASGSFASAPATVSLPGIRQPGTYLVYEPAQGTNTAQINYGFALLADDSTAETHGLQLVQIEDSSGNLLPQPTATFFPLSAATDLDGQALTPDASHGAVVDGSNQVYFFAGIPQHQVAISPTTVDVSAYGGDGDSIVALPAGDEVVVSADDGGALAVISGILSGSPVVADTIPNPNNNGRDGLVISSDGTIMLSRGNSSGTTGIDVYKITHGAAHAGSTNQGTTSYTFALTQTLASPGSVVSPAFEDGRDAMAISPTDPTRAVIGGFNASGNSMLQLLTGLGSGSVTVQSLNLRTAAAAHRRAVAAPEPSSHRLPAALTFGLYTEITAVAISPDGTTAYVSTNVGIYTVSGVNTGTLTQVGSVYNPTLTVPGGTCNAADTFEGAATIGILPDGKYLVAVENCQLAFTGNQGPGVLFVAPIGSGGVLGAPVSQYNFAFAPYNDQMITH